MEIKALSAVRVAKLYNNLVNDMALCKEEIEKNFTEGRIHLGTRYLARYQTYEKVINDLEEIMNQ